MLPQCYHNHSQALSSKRLTIMVVIITPSEKVDCDTAGGDYYPQSLSIGGGNNGGNQKCGDNRAGFELTMTPHFTVSDTIEYYGVFAASLLITTAGTYLERKLGKRDATLRRGPTESPLWRVERVNCYRLYRDVMPSAPQCPTLYSVNEAAWLVGVTRNKLLQIAPQAPAVALSAGCEKEYHLWPEHMLQELRKQIGCGAIEVNRRSLTRPKLGVVIAPPRHTLAENQLEDAKAHKQAYPMLELAASL
jgi:hypothetical protein